VARDLRAGALIAALRLTPPRASRGPGLAQCTVAETLSDACATKLKGIITGSGGACSVPGSAATNVSGSSGGGSG